MKKPIYLDNHATTPMDPRVLKAMLPYFADKFGNAASGTHSFGREAAAAVERARKQTADLIGARPDEIVFTSGATESNNLALKGGALAALGRSKRLVTVATEHKSVLDPAKRLESEGWEVVRLGVAHDGSVDTAALASALARETTIVSVMAANNEIGTIHPIAELARTVRHHRAGTLFHCDAAQAVGKIPFDVRKLDVDFVSFTAHKLYGPKGVGALYVRRSDDRATLVPLFDGGGHERGLRSGTLNVPGIVGFGEACRLARVTLHSERRKTAKLRDRLFEALEEFVPHVTLNGPHGANRLANNLNIRIEGIRAADLMKALPQIAFSAGSACLSTSPTPSHVLSAIGLDRISASECVRFGVGRFNTDREMNDAARLIIAAIERLRTPMRNAVAF